MAYNYTCKSFIKRKMGVKWQKLLSIQMDNTRDSKKTDKNSKTWQANFLKSNIAILLLSIKHLHRRHLFYFNSIVILDLTVCKCVIIGSKISIIPLVKAIVMISQIKEVARKWKHIVNMLGMIVLHQTMKFYARKKNVLWYYRNGYSNRQLHSECWYHYYLPWIWRLLQVF